MKKIRPGYIVATAILFILISVINIYFTSVAISAHPMQINLGFPSTWLTIYIIFPTGNIAQGENLFAKMQLGFNILGFIVNFALLYAFVYLLFWLARQIKNGKKAGGKT